MVLQIAYIVLWRWTMSHGLTSVPDRHFPVWMPWRWLGSLALCGQRLNIQSTVLALEISTGPLIPVTTDVDHCAAGCPSLMGVAWLGVLLCP